MTDEEIRTFFVRRPWLHGDRDHAVLSGSEYQRLKDRRLILIGERRAYLEAFIDGWLAAKS